jgi:VanZ family protein
MVQSSLTFPGRVSQNIIIVVLLTMGIGVELIQEVVPNRGFEMRDIVANVSGLLLGYLICFGITATGVQRRCD